MKTISGDVRVQWIRENTCLGLEIQADIFDEFLSNKDDSKLLDAFLKEKTNGALILYLEEVHSNGNSVFKGQTQQNENLVKSKSGNVYKKGTLHACMHHLPQELNEVRSIFFVKNNPDAVPIPPSSVDDTDAFLGNIIEYGVLCGSPLQMLGQSITQVHQPLLDISQNTGRVSDTLKNEFSGNLHRFSGQILHALQQVNGEVRLNIPNIIIEDSKAVMDDEKILLEIEAAVDEWTPIIAQILEKQLKKYPKGKGALAEIEFWRDRCAALSTLYEQLNTPNVKKMIEALEGIDSPNLQAFRAHFNDLIKQYLDAKDNVKFLTTLERHFKNLSHGSLATILDTLPSMLNALRMVWIISRHYNKDENMVPLMERIAWEIANKVSTVINVRQIFRDPPNEMKKKIFEAQTVLQKWKEVYLDIRQKIEQSGRDQRWEFDRRRLFDHTDYMAERCADLYEVATVIDQFYSILGPELKAVTGDIHKIDEVLKRVQDMLHAIETVAFDIFDKRYQSGWEATMSRFNHSVAQIEETAKQFIDASFHNLRSAEGAFELLQNFKNIKSRPSIDKLMMDKFADVLKRYKVEVEKVRALFNDNEVAPPCSKNLPPIAGAINWSQSLLQKIKKPIVRFQTLKEMMETDSGKYVTKEYLKTGRSMRDFEQKLYKQWCDNVEQVAMSRLNDFILVEAADTKEISVNFHPDLSAVIRETKYLDKLGYTIPETALNITLQEDKYHKYIEELKGLLKTYYGALAVVTSEEKPLLVNHTQILKNSLRPGLDVLNWNSLSVPNFIKKCSQEIAKFQSTVNQIQKNESMIGSVIEAIAAAKLVCDPVPPPGEESMDLQEYYDQFEKHRKTVVEELVRKYKTVGPLLGKIEGITDDSTTQNNPKMKSYYKFWERRVFNALNKMVLTNLNCFQKMMGLVGTKNSPARPATLFKITAALSAPDIVIHPSFNDINKVVGVIMKNIVDSSTNFIRWMDGSCVETRPQQVTEDGEPIIFSFHTDISANPQVIKTALIINQSIHRSFGSIGKFLEGWKRYKMLWKLDKEQVLQRFADKKPSVVAYDEKLGLYSKLLREVDALNTERDIDFIRISCVPLVASVKSEASAWLFALGKQLNESVKASLLELNEQLGKIQEELQRSPDTMDDLKFMLNVIDQIYSQSVEIEARFLDIEERYRTLHIHHFPVIESEEELLYTVGVGWRHLILRAKMVDESLVLVKAQFTETTKKQVQMFKEKIGKLQKKFKEQGPGAEGTALEAGAETVKKFTVTLAKYNSTREELVLAEKLFNLNITSYPELVEIENEIKGYGQVFQAYADFQEAQAKWANTLWAELDISVLTVGVENFLQRLKRLPKELQNTFPFKTLMEKVNSFKDSIPLFADLKNEALRPRHWKTLMDVTGKSFQTNSKSFTLEAVFGMELHKYAEKIAEITSGAVKELSIEQGIQTIADTWKNLRFEVVKYLKGTEDRGFILKGIDDIQALLDDNSMSLQAMSISRYVSAFQTQVQQWEKRLSLIGEVADVWMHVQRKWMYLEIIFVGSGDIRLQLPDEAKRFERIDKTFKKIMSDTAKNTLVLEACQTEGRLDLLNSLLSQLEVCQKSLSEYLETKRNAFPRFFFISDDELLSILGSTDPTNVQEHMLKLYDNVLALRFGTGRNSHMVTGMTSSEGEFIDFKQHISAEGMVETWMTNVEAEMRRTLRTIAKEAVFYYPKSSRIKWIFQYPGMITLSGSQIWWTWEVEEAFRQVRSGDKYAMKKLSAKLATQLSELVNEVRSDMTSLDRKKVNTLLIVDVHARDIIDRFVRDSILDEREFEWESQLRFYWNRDLDDIQVRQCTGAFSYGHEYMGLNGRLVITPLTDRCIMTLTQALSMKLGGAPAGPAGTGKTETVKDLAKALGLLCVVFNCGENIDYATMGRIFAGLVQCGGWGCFDEFNRIDAEVLSVISAQIKTIQHAMNSGLKRFQFDGKEISLDMKCGIFITMNPGYAGRSELPDNLKSLFRPVVMVVPDLELISEIMLFSEGFDSAKQLARKMTVLYRLSQEQLSKQHHYDFGLRALKSVLVMAGNLKRSSPDLSEEMVIMRALRDMNLPKFVFEDVPLFKGLLSDLFPDLSPPRVSYKAFKEAVESELSKKDYIIIPEQVDKVIQLYETMLTRHCVMVVGPTGGGKTVVVDTLARAQTALGFPTKLYPINPKAQTVNELYGILDPNTRDWTDGLLSNIFREVNKPQAADKKDLKYIMFDGDVDAVWVENMNTVMDDNRLLTLPNGERIRLQKHCSLLFEVADLSHASPATVSRCGMVYLSPQNLGYKPYFLRWLNIRNNKNEMKVMKGLFDKYIPATLEYVLEGTHAPSNTVGKRLKTSVPVTNLNMVTQLCNMLSMILTNSNEINDSRVFESVFIFAMYWSIGATLTEDSRIAFDSFVKMISDWPSIDNPDLAVGPGHIPTHLPLWYDYMFDEKEQKWVSWASLVPRYAPPVNQKFYDIMVPTVDSVRNTWLLGMAIQNHQPILFMGESGTAKTVTIQNYISALSADAWAKLDINFSSRTTSLDLQRTVEYNVEKWSKGIYGPSPGKHLVIFIDDVNMPKVDKYNTQQPIALLKLMIERGGFYDRGKELNWKTLRNVQVVAAMGPPGGGRNSVDPRFISLFNVFNIPFPQQDTLKKIYSSILDYHLEPFSDSIKEVVGNVTDATMKLYLTIQATLPPTPSKFHYIFNMRDLSRVYEGLCQATIDKFDTPDSFIRLWRNECLRVFHDRLISDHDRDAVKGMVNQLLTEKFPDYAAHALVDPILFGDFRNVAQDVEDVRIYEDLKDFETLKPIFEDILLNYNEKITPPMNLVLFEDALDHLTRIMRIICRPRGHALLVGIGGSGRQSLTRLAAFAANYSLFEISLTGGYGELELREDLKKLYNMLGMENKQTVFLFTDNHVVEEGFLELINNMLTTGMVPALFSDDEKEGVINAVRDDVVKARLLDSRENCWKFFLDRARDNLHIVLCMSPTGEALRRRCRAFPGLVNNTVIDWFTPWPEQALFAVANVFLAEEDLPEEHRSDLVNHMVSSHLSLTRFSDKFEQLLRRKNHVTPKNFLDYINIYRKLLKENRKRMIDQTKRLDGGLHKLIEAAEHLAELNEKLQVQKVQVDEQTQVCANLLSTIGQSKEKVETSQALATQKEKELQELSVQIQAKKVEAESSLEAALPVLEAAKLALQNLSKNDITEIRSFAKPPKAVQVVCECVAIVRNEKDVSWKGAKAMMTSPSFLNQLLEMNADEISEKQIRAVKDNIKNMGMPPEKMSSISAAGAGLLTWLLAIVNYCSVSKKVAPKRKAVETAQKQQKQNQKDLETIQAEVASLTEELAKLSEQYNQGIAQQKELSEQAELMEKRLTAAHKLISGLSTEKVRWTQELEVLAESQKRVVGDSLLCASFLSYCGPFSFEFRRAMVYGEWYEDLVKRGIPVTTPFRLETLLTTEVEISKWASEGLPSDELSVQNGVFTTKSTRWPLCIDPQMQAVNWIKKKESNNKLIIRTFADPDFAKQLELAVQYGVPMLVEGVDEYIDPLMDPVLEKNVNIVGSRKFIRLGDKEVDWNDNFRLYLATKLSNPNYPPGYFGKMSIINCNVTQHGLQEQLLNIVVGFERPELEQQREQLVREMSENKGLLKNFEDMLLEELANSSGMMLDNQELISTLEDTKTKSIEIAEKLELAKVTAAEINLLRDGYQAAAKRGAILFFVLATLSAINTMYEHSLAAFTEVFRKSLVISTPDPTLNRRLQNIITTLTQNVYDYTCMGLFEKHKLLFSFQMCIQIMQSDELIRLDYLDFFLKGNFSLEKSSVKNPFPSWLPDQGWEDLQKLVTFGEPFNDLVTHISNNEKAWKDWYDIDALEATPPPIPDSEKWSTFERMLVIRCFRVDRVYNSVRNFVMENMGERFVQPPIITYADIYDKSSPNTPVIFILSPGADPANDVIKLADKMGFGGTKLKLLALGQNQGPLAAQLLENGVQRGQWIMLQNCHLLTSWLKTLETILDAIKNPHKDFRLWLTTEPTPLFPIGTLQRSLKVVTEPPNGLKLNMRSSYSKITNEVLAQSPHAAFRSLVYVLAFFHAVVQERRKYGKVGWNVPYDFNESDFSVSLKILDTYLSKAHINGDNMIPWGSLRYLIGEVMYGGRVTDSFDRRVLMTYLHEYMGDFLFDTFQPFFFYKDSAVTYNLPKDGPLENYVEMIESLPHVNTPDVFGLHPNAEIGYYTNASKEMFSNLILLQPNSSDTGGGSRRENIISNIANDILQKIPEAFDIPLIQKGIENMTPTTVVLLQELERWNKLVENMKQSLLLLQKALVGEIGMSTELEELSQSLFIGGIPSVWRKLAPDTQKSLANWLLHFRQRYDQYSTWIKAEPVVMWLSGLHVPEAYLTALVQTACRKNKWPLDKTSLFTKVTTITNPALIKERPEHGCYISGLYLEGAAWDHANSVLRRQDPKMLVVEFPVIHVIPTEVHKLRLQGTFHTPVYITQERRNKMGTGLVFAADLPTREHSSHWVLQGVCLTLNIA